MDNTQVYIVTDARTGAVHPVIASSEVHARKAVAITLDGTMDSLTAVTVEGTIEQAFASVHEALSA